MADKLKKYPGDIPGHFCIQVSACFILASSLLAKTIARIKAAVSAMGPAYMTPSIPIKRGRITIRGSEKNKLSGKGHDNSKFCFSDGGKKSCRHGLYAVGKGQKHKNPKIAFCKLKVQIASCSEKSYNLVREKLKTEKKYSCDNGTGSYGITISFLTRSYFPAP